VHPNVKLALGGSDDDFCGSEGLAAPNPNPKVEAGVVDLFGSEGLAVPKVIFEVDAEAESEESLAIAAGAPKLNGVFAASAAGFDGSDEVLAAPKENPGFEVLLPPEGSEGFSAVVAALPNVNPDVPLSLGSEVSVPAAAPNGNPIGFEVSSFV